MKKPPGKWIKGLSPQQDALEVAREVLSIRLQAVEQMLPLAVHHADENLEHVHQLRVATRRADAALRLFRPCVRGRKFRTARRRLRRIRRAAGAARECDVHRGIFAEHRAAADAAGQSVLDGIVAWLDELRETAQADLVRAGRRYPGRKLHQKHRELIDALRRPRLTPADASRPTFLDLARAVLPPSVEGLRAAAAQDLHVLENLHGVRIAAKRLRYAMEVFAACFGEDFEQRYGTIETMQEELGAINDLHELIARIEHYDVHRGSSASPDATMSLKEHYRAQLHTRAEAFRSRWEAGEWRELLALDLPDPRPTDSTTCRV